MVTLADDEGSFEFGDGDDDDHSSDDEDGFEFGDDHDDDHARDDHAEADKDGGDDGLGHAGEEESESNDEAAEQSVPDDPNATNRIDSPESRIPVARATDVEAGDDGIEQELIVSGEVERGDTDTFEIDVSAATDAGTTITSVEATPGQIPRRPPRPSVTGLSLSPFGTMPATRTRTSSPKYRSYRTRSVQSQRRG